MADGPLPTATQASAGWLDRRQWIGADLPTLCRADKCGSSRNSYGSTEETGDVERSVPRGADAWPGICGEPHGHQPVPHGQRSAKGWKRLELAKAAARADTHESIPSNSSSPLRSNRLSPGAPVALSRGMAYTIAADAGPFRNVRVGGRKLLRRLPPHERCPTASPPR
jgi:hypothetical protein